MQGMTGETDSAAHSPKNPKLSGTVSSRLKPRRITTDKNCPRLIFHPAGGYHDKAGRQGGGFVNELTT